MPLFSRGQSADIAPSLWNERGPWPELETPEQVAETAGSDDAERTVAQVVVKDVDILRHLALPREGAPTTTDLTVRIAVWEAPTPRWRGSLGQVRGLDRVDVSFDPGRRKALARVLTSSPVPIFEIANALIPLFAPATPFAGAGFPLVAVAPGAGDAVLPLLPNRTVPPVEPMVERLQGVGLRRADLLLDAEHGVADAEDLATHRLTVAEAAHAVPRTERPVIDLAVHNPIGRELVFKPSRSAAALVIDGRTARLETTEADVPASDAGDFDAPEPFAFDVERPLPAAAVRRLRGIEDIDLSGLGSVPEGLAARFAEIAATDTILHSLPAGATIAEEALAPEITDAIRRPYRQTMGLERELRSVELRRAAMREHGGFFRLAEAARATTGYRLLPRVSVILSTMRPELIPGVLEMMAKQTYAEMEVVVIVHGVPAPDLSGADLGDLEVRIVEVAGDVMFGAALAEGVRRSTGDLITKLDDDDWYSEHHVSDLVLAHLYSRADIVGKTTEYLFFEEVNQTVHRTFATERYHDQVAGGAMLLTRSAFDALGGWRPTPNSTDRSVLIRVETQGGVGYRTQSLGYMYIRHAAKHTWPQTGSQLVRGSFEQWRGWRHPEVGY
ncbi:glycosyltransferase family 2 protein [Microbacterium indicum]|uniref:glycosyltransferase family 2 protein n=1 Tax=Microbacterium indicum TaxID=358100 RepID=UPI000404070B|nr:glycosyltransferase [Microbacterium indicum]